MVDLSVARAAALEVAALWGEELEEPFAMSNTSFVAPTRSGAVLKVPFEGDDESLHEGDALALWDGDGAVRLLRRSGRCLLEERLVPGDDLSGVDEEEATRVAVDLATRLWRPATPPFRPVAPEVERWLQGAEREGLALAGLARKLYAEVGGGAGWVVHGDLHHHNILRHGGSYVAIDPKPYLADREYDVASFLWNPMGNLMGDASATRRRIDAFVAAGLDEFKVRAWTVIRGSYLRTDAPLVAAIAALSP